MLGPDDSSGVLLLVDGDALHAQAVGARLAAHVALGREVETATTSAQAAARLARGGVGCVVLELTLPDARGLDAVQALRSVDPTVPVVVLSEQDSDGLALQALQAGAQDYLVKGQHSLDVLARAVMFAIARSRREVADAGRLIPRARSGEQSVPVRLP